MKMRGSLLGVLMMAVGCLAVLLSSLECVSGAPLELDCLTSPIRKPPRFGKRMQAQHQWLMQRIAKDPNQPCMSRLFHRSDPLLRNVPPREPPPPQPEVVQEPRQPMTQPRLKPKLAEVVPEEGQFAGDQFEFDSYPGREFWKAVMAKAKERRYNRDNLVEDVNR